MRDAALLSARGLTVRFGGLVAVDQVDFEIAPAAFVGIIGPNGAGKTSFFNVLCGLAQPTAGRIVIAGEDLTGRPPHLFARRGVARTFQTPRVFAGMTVADNVSFGMEFAGRGRGSVHALLADARSILELLGLCADARALAREITPARQRLLEIGMALATRPRILLLDEVAAGLTESEIEATAVLVERLRAELGIAVAWIEHAAGVLLRHVDRVAVLHQGQKIADGMPAEVARDRAVIEAYLGDIEEGTPA